jgi:hypothetical protein
MITIYGEHAGGDVQMLDPHFGQFTPAQAAFDVGLH